MRYKKLADIQKAVEADEYEWDLSPEHELTYKTRGTANGKRETEAEFTAAIISAEPDALVVSVTTQEDEKHTTTGLVKLSGKWELDENNRITFLIKREFDKDNKLTFQGAWEVNKKHEVVYAFETKQVLEGRGKRRRRVTKVMQELVFKGEWDLSEKHCLTYFIGVDTDSAFRFRGAFETQSILAKEGEIRYQAGIEYKLKSGAPERVTQTITLFGKWKLSDDLALSFEIEYANGRRSEIRVGTEFNLAKLQAGFPLLPDEVTVNLISREGNPLGLEVILTKDLFDGDVQTFIRFRKSLEETAIEAGIKIPW